MEEEASELGGGGLEEALEVEEQEAFELRGGGVWEWSRKHTSEEARGATTRRREPYTMTASWGGGGLWQNRLV